MSRSRPSGLAAALCAAALGPFPSSAQVPGLTVEYLAHASFVIESPGGTRVLIDPYADKVWLGYDFPTGVETDAWVITHPHYDHDGGEFRGLDVPWSQDQPVFRDPGRFRVGDIGLLGVAGKHAGPYGKEFGQKNTIWVLEVGVIRIAHLGDNGPLTPEMVEGIGRVDILMLPVDGEEHILSYVEVGEILVQLDPRVVIPMHYRLPELEPGDGPSDLGPIDPWIRGRDRVRRLQGNRWSISGNEPLPEGSVVVFQPSRSVPRPSR